MRREGGRSLCDGGETLLEILVSVVILGIASTAVLGLLQMSVGASDIHHKESVAGSILDNFAEYVQDASSTPYVSCPGAVAAYDSARSTFLAQLAAPTSAVYEPGYLVAGTPRYSLAITIDGGDLQPAGSDPSVLYSGGCAAAETSGLQRITLTVTSQDTMAVEQTVIVKRKP